MQDMIWRFGNSLQHGTSLRAPARSFLVVRLKLRPGVASALSSERDGYVPVHPQPTRPYYSNEPTVATRIMADKSAPIAGRLHLI
jgi:hypothetical protein